MADAGAQEPEGLMVVTRCMTRTLLLRPGRATTLVPRMRCSTSKATWCTADPGPSLFFKQPGSRVCSAPFHAALRPGHESEKKIPLRHRQHLGGRAGEQLAVGAHLVGFRIDLDVWRGVVVDHVLFVDRARLLNRD